jgi:tRNA G10  N-methylase Trm11
MMINVALLSSDFDYNNNTHMLDPVAGKGPTLFDGAVYGFDVFGIEIKPKSVHEACIFFKRFLEKERYKHSTSKRKLYGRSNESSSIMHEFEYSINKDDYKVTDTRKKLSIISGNSIHTSQYFKRNTFHIIVGDLPYGVTHGNVTKKKNPL